MFSFDFDTCCLYTYYDLTPLYSFTMFTFIDFYICLLFFMNFYTAPCCFFTTPFAYFFVLLVFLDILFPFIYVRKLPWLSRQSDRLLTDRSLVRSQAEAPFLLFPNPYIYETRQKSTPPVGLEPTTARLRAARSTDWARKATDVIPNMSLFYQYCPLHA